MTLAPVDLNLAVADEAHVDAARRAVLREARRLTLDETFLGRLALVVQEMARNLLLHAGHGELHFNRNGQGFDLLAVDSGPGMANVAQCLSDHYSTKGTMGAGLGAIRRLSDRFDIYSQAGRGTVVFSRFELGADKSRDGLISGALSTPYPGEEVCGDAWAVKGNRVMVCDGLGHGVSAHLVGQRARELFLAHDPAMPLAQLMEQFHRALMSTRGGALAFAEVLLAEGQLNFCGIGNIAGSLVADKSRGLVSANGTIGYKAGRIQPYSYPWDESSLLIMSSDGLTSKCGMSGYPGLTQRHPAVVAAVLHRDFRRHNDDATVLVLKNA
ncbi:ATP-binding protein [Pseudomonas sp. RIT-PI-AD]|uniref:ATP-binding protein n=1 Tax=Pseudomonas sp. RIT-PI-AD TaxID=3035294 RepID=UPI0021DAE301|nr:ATP-binding protein [Pseudomonas sp. RIT-PI-AD]